MIYPGSRVKVFRHQIYKNDVDTPLSMTMQTATVLCRYGFRSKIEPSWIYEDCVDVQFDDGTISHGHFTSGVEEL